MHINKIWTFSLTMRAYLFQCDGISGSFSPPPLHSSLPAHGRPCTAPRCRTFLGSHTSHWALSPSRVRAKPDETNAKSFIGRRLSATATPRAEQGTERKRYQLMRTSNSDMKYNVRAKTHSRKRTRFADGNIYLHRK